MPAVDEARARIYDDLRGVVEGELYFEPLDRAPYAIDASLYEIDPLGVVVPRSEDDVVNVLRYAAENRIAVHVRGAGTDTGGGSLGPGLVVDLSRHLRQVIAIGGEHVVVAAGVVLDVLNAQLAPLGRRLEPVTYNSDVTTVGGMIAVDAAGPRSMQYGSTGDQVDRLRVVFAGGEVADLGFEAWPTFEAEPADFKDLIVRKLQTIYRNSEGRLTKSCPSPRRNRAGYALARAAGETGIHLGRLVAGSEGTWRHAPGGAAHGPASAGLGGRPAGFRRLARRRGVRRRDSEPAQVRLFVRSVRPPFAQPGARRRRVVSRLDRRGGRGHLDGRIRGSTTQTRSPPSCAR